MKALILVLMSSVLLLGRNFDFLGGYCSLRMVTVRYRSLLLVPTSSLNGFYGKQVPNSYIDNSRQG